MQTVTCSDVTLKTALSLSFKEKIEIAKLLDNQRRFRTDPDFVEHIARQNHRVFPGELVFMFNEGK